MKHIEGATIHYGLSVAEYKTHVDPTATNIGLLLQWARETIKNYEIQIDTPNYEVLLQGPEAFEVTDFGERQEYFRTIFALCMDNGESR